MHSRSRRVFVPLLTAALAICVCLVASAAWADVLKRKNIDRLTAQELAAYEHAIQVMMDRSAKNPYDKTGYLWQAWVHNCPSTWVPKDGKPDNREPACDFWAHRDPPDPAKYELANPGMCEHGKDLFLPWHRAEFYYFEKIVQGADPDGTVTDSRGNTGPSTRNVTVPYWNWTRTPSGNRYPRAFENPASPLFHKARFSEAVAPSSAFPFASPYLIGYMLNFQDWPEFGGFPKSTNGGFGVFEAASHNPMHSEYINGPMGSPSTAALDPIFFSFHSYIDLLYEHWIEIHGTDGITSKEFFLRASQPAEVTPAPGFTSGSGKPSMGQVKLYFDTKKLGYEYEVVDDDKPVSRAELTKLLGLDNPQDPPVFGSTARNLFSRLLDGGDFQPKSRPAIVRTLDIKIPAAAALSDKQRFIAQFDRNQHEADFSYQMDVYVYPAQAPFDPASKPFRDRYMAAAPGVYWGTGTVHHHDDITPLKIDITPAVLDLIKNGHSGETWKMSVAVTVLPSLTTFGEPSLQAVPPLH